MPRLKTRAAKDRLLRRVRRQRLKYITILPSLITDVELESLWKVGVDGIVVPPTQSAETLSELRRMIDSLPRGVRQRRDKVADVALPHYGGDIEAEEEES